MLKTLRKTRYTPMNQHFTKQKERKKDSAIQIKAKYLKFKTLFF